MRRAANLRHLPARVVGLAVGWAWGLRSLRALRVDLGAAGLHASPSTPRSVGPGTLRGANVALRQGRATCLERSLVVQRWLATAGIPRTVAVGVRRPDVATATGGATAHAWVEDYDADCSETFSVIRRIPPPGLPAHGQ